MRLQSDIPQISMQQSRGVLVASIQVDLDEQVIADFQQTLLEQVQATGVRGVILDCSGLLVLDAEEFEALRRIGRMTRLMGAETVLSGLRPGVVSALAEVAEDLGGVRATLDIDAGFALFEAERTQAVEPDESSDEDDGIEPGPEPQAAASPLEAMLEQKT